MSKYAKRVDIVSIQMVKESSIKYEKRKIYSADDAYNLIRPFLENSDREKSMICCMNIKNEPICISTISIGTLDESIVHPREIFKTALLANAAYIIIFHNHPSGDPSPSKEDINITLRIKEAGNILGIKLLDHIIIGDDNRYVSLKEKINL